MTDQSDNVEKDQSSAKAKPVLDARIMKAALRQTRLNSNRPGSVQELIKQCRTTARFASQLEAHSRTLLYDELSITLQIFGLATTSTSVKKQVQNEARRVGIPRTNATPLALLLVKLCIGSDEAAASQQAQALNGALLKNIAPADLPDYLKQEGGITELASFFKTEREIHDRDNGKARRSKQSRPTVPKLKLTGKVRASLRQAELKGITKVRMWARHTNQGWLIETVQTQPAGG
jgi:hypothetical protein